MFEARKKKPLPRSTWLLASVVTADTKNQDYCLTNTASEDGGDGCHKQLEQANYLFVTSANPLMRTCLTIATIPPALERGSIHGSTLRQLLSLPEKESHCLSHD